MSRPLYYVESRWGGSEDEPPQQRMRELIAELATRDEEHPDTWLTHVSSGWTLTLDEDRFAHLSDANGNVVSHMSNVSPEQALQLWLLHAREGKEAMVNEQWKQGRRPVSAAELAVRKARATELTLASDREFYALLGLEDSSPPCRARGCSRGSIKHSVLCRVHHFEQIRRKPCPFNE